MKTYLKKNQIDEIQAEKDAIQRTLSSGYAQDKPGMNRRTRELDSMLENQSPPPTTPERRDELNREIRVLEDFIKEAMPTDEEMRRKYAGSVDAHHNWERRSATHLGIEGVRTGKDAVLKWKNDKREQNPDSDDPDLANVERLRRRSGGRVAEIDPFIQAKEYYVPTEKFRENYDQIFGESVEAKIQRLTDEMDFLKRQLAQKNAGESHAGPEDIESAIREEASRLEAITKAEKFTAPCGKQIASEKYLKSHQLHCKSEACNPTPTEAPSEEVPSWESDSSQV